MDESVYSIESVVSVSSSLEVVSALSLYVSLYFTGDLIRTGVVKVGKLLWDVSHLALIIGIYQ